ncbi:ABC transporter substrate-binding protein [Lachnoclostridium sp. Marseille-P6806]|uniref:ABC transporter substrate-binding protein n=1 Tax=Lachnoclostridium sp. Marseille-P6806 TaxID=2364793 RepID=UPI0010309A6B|nr:ABC transporter substrate-binding protein [Lachnoclostridium sp. Marseille-P6806]
MKKRIAGLVLSAAMAAGLLAGCGGAASSGGMSGEEGKDAEPETTGENTESASSDTAKKPYEGVTITLWGGTTEFNEGFQAVIERATEELGIKFETEINPGGTEGDNIIKTRCASGDLPDLSAYNSGSLLTALNPKEHFLDLTDEGFMQNVDDTFKSVVSQDGRVYGAPFPTTQGGCVIYWKPDYEELGLTVPTTWEDFVANCRKLKDAGKTPVELTCGDTWTTQVLFLGDNYNLISAEPEFAQNFTEGTAKFAETEAAVRSWNKYADIRDFYNADASAATYNDGITAMANGEATHWFMLTQVIPMMVAENPDCADKVGVFAIPGDDPDRCGLTVWEPGAWYVNRDSENKEACLAFLEFWLRKDNMDLYINTFGASGPSCVKGYTLPETVVPAIRVDMQQYFDAGKTIPALEFLTTIKGASCEQITTAAALGQISGAEAAKQYDDDCKKSAMQQGLNWN